MKPIDLDAGYVASLTIEGAARPSLVGSGARRAAARKCRLNLAFVLLAPVAAPRADVSRWAEAPTGLGPSGFRHGTGRCSIVLTDGEQRGSVRGEAT
jgi:hypothetical protein